MPWGQGLNEIGRVSKMVKYVNLQRKRSNILKWRNFCESIQTYPLNFALHFCYVIQVNALWHHLECDAKYVTQKKNIGIDLISLIL